MLRFATFFTLIAGILLLQPSCKKKDQLLTDPSAKLTFTDDSVLFDTVFTAIGSATRNIRVINNNDQKIKISSLYISGGSASPFFLNVDGMPGKSFTDVEIAAHDSIYIFIQVNVDPTNQNSPLVINDQILFQVNGNQQSVALEAWGQDAYYHYPNQAIQFKNGYLAYSTVATGNNQTVNWVNDKPHVIYGWLVVDSTQTLNIAAGVTVYLHQNAGLWVYRYGTLKVNGTLGNEVTFKGDRREMDYANIAGQWDRIWINEGSNANLINYAIIKNSFIGVQAEYIGSGGTINLNEPGRLTMNNTIIQNASQWGFFGSLYNVNAGNNVISNCQGECVYLLGGNYSFVHSTFANYWTDSERKTACVTISNYTVGVVLPLDSAYFGNCIIDGNTQNELKLDLNTSNSSLLPDYWFSSSLVRTTNNTSDASRYIDCRIMKQTGTPPYNAAFTDPANYNFKLKSTSSAINFPTVSNPKCAIDAAKFPFDVHGDARPNPASPTLPDAGAYEYH